MAGKKTSRFWEFRNSAEGDSAELLLYGVISESTWWGDEITPKMFADELAALGEVSAIKVRINSPGGDLFAANAIYNALRNHAARVTTYVDGLAASAASVVAMAGDTVVMPGNAMMMIHNPETIAVGDAREMRATADLLDKARETTISAYALKTGMERSKIINLLNSETWMTAAEAVEMGFADEIDERAYVTASLRGRNIVVNGLGFGLDKFKTIPAAMLADTGEEVRQTMGKVKNEEAEIPEGTSPQPSPEKGGGTVEEVETPAAEEAEAPVAEEAAAPVASAEVVAERERIAAISALARPGAEEIIATAISGGAQPGDVALEILNSDAVRNAAALAARRTDAPAPIPGASEPEPTAKGQRVSALVAAYRKVRGLDKES